MPVLSAVRWSFIPPGLSPPSSTQNSELKEQASQAAPETIPAQSDEKRSFRFPWQKEEKAPWEK